jgi:hypothetical protein
LAANEKQPQAEFHLGDELSDDHREDLQQMLYRGQNEVTRKNAYPFLCVDDTLYELKDANI